MSKKIKTRRPNALKIVIILLLLHAGAYGNGSIDKADIYRIVRRHYRIKKTRAVKIQLEMLLQSGIIEKEGDIFTLSDSPLLAAGIYNILQEAPDDIFPVYHEELAFFHLASVSDIPVQGIEREIQAATGIEGKYDRDSLFHFMLKYPGMGESFNRDSLKAIGEDMYSILSAGGHFIQDISKYPNLHEIIFNAFFPEPEIEDIIECIKASSQAQAFIFNREKWKASILERLSIFSVQDQGSLADLVSEYTGQFYGAENERKNITEMVKAALEASGYFSTNDIKRYIGIIRNALKQRPTLRINNMDLHAMVQEIEIKEICGKLRIDRHGDSLMSNQSNLKFNGGTWIEAMSPMLTALASMAHTSLLSSKNVNAPLPLHSLIVRSTPYAGKYHEIDRLIGHKSLYNRE